jgi:ATP adenylyltransferase
VVSRLWAPWRITYVAGAAEPATGCIFCETLSGDDDRRRWLLTRSTDAFLILNAYPYASGHVLAVVNRHVATVEEATVGELTDAFRLVQLAVAALRREYTPDGFNIGVNQGRVAGAGIEGHLHIHVVPRWTGDTNFMPVLGDVKVLPESLDRTWERLKTALGR